MSNSDNTRNAYINQIGDGYWANSFYGTYDHFQRIGWFFDKIIESVDELDGEEENCFDVLTGRFVYVISDDAIFMRDYAYEEPGKQYVYYPNGNYQYISSTASFEVVTKIGYGKVLDNGLENPTYYIEKYGPASDSIPFEKNTVSISKIPEGILPLGNGFNEDDSWILSSTTFTRNGKTGYTAKEKKYYENGNLVRLERNVYEGLNIVEAKVVEYIQPPETRLIKGFRFIGFATRKTKLLLGENGEYINYDFSNDIPYKIAQTKNIQQMSAYYFPTDKNKNIFRLNADLNNDMINDFQIFTSDEMNIFDKDRYEEGSYEVHE